MKCVHCGSELLPGAKFCTNCGTPVEEIKPANDIPEAPQDPMSHWPAPDFSSPLDSGFSSEESQNTDESTPAPDSEIPSAEEQNPFDAQAPGFQEMPPQPPQHQPSFQADPYGYNAPAGGGSVPPPYGGQPFYPQAPVPPKKSRTGLIVGIVVGVAVIIIAIIVILLVMLFNQSGDTSSSNTPPDTTSSSISSGSTSGSISSGVFEGPVQTVSLGSASFQVPESWDAEIDDNRLFLYPSDDDMLVVFCFEGEGGFLSDFEYLESLVSDYEGYEYRDMYETSIGSVSGVLHTYYATVDEGVDCQVSNFYFTVGDDLMSADYFLPTLSSQEGMAPLENLMSTLQTSASSSLPEETSSASSSTASGVYTEGMYKVGTDIPAGEYVLLPNSEISGYYEVDSDSSGALESIIYNDNFDGRRYLTVEDGQYLVIKRCEMVPVDQAPAVDTSSGVVPEGMYRVGVDIPAGEYRLEYTGEYSGYYEVRLNSRAIDGYNYDTIITSDSFDSSVYVTVEDGQYFLVSGGEITLP